MYVIKKDGTLDEFNPMKIKVAISKSAKRAMITLSEEVKEKIADSVKYKLMEKGEEKYPIELVHNLVENALEEFSPETAKSYKDYRNYKQDFVHMMDEVFEASQHIRFIGDKENSNSDSSLVATKRCLIFNELNKRLYRKFFMTKNELQACKEGYIYIHDQSARLDTFNCDLIDLGNVMKGGFEMGNVWYNEPKSLDTAFDVMGDIILSTAAQQYGGFTVPEVDKILSPYADKSYQRYINEWLEIRGQQTLTQEGSEYAFNKVKRDFEQGWQGIEYKLNTVGSSRGDYPFVTMTFGLATDRFGKLASLTFLDVHKKGQGKEGNKKPVLFPKLVFLYDEELHGEGKINNDIFEAGIDCSCKTMYPDWLSLSGEGYVSEMYKKYGRVVSPMGCVDGQEIITYKFKNNLYVESFERMWGRITSELEDVGQHSETDVNRIVDLTNSGVLIYDTLKGFVKVKYLIRNVQDNWCDVSISKGRKLRTTSDHPFETQRGVVQAKDLNVGDEVQINTGQYSEGNLKKSHEEAWLNGFMLCDGCYQNYSLFASIAEKGEEDIEDYFIKSFNNVYGLIPKTVIQERGKKGFYKDLKVYSDGSNKLKYLISHFTELFGGVQKKYRQIPNEVFSYNEEAKYAFLAGMIDADGYINGDLKKHKYATVQIGSTNKELALQQMALAQSLGMSARVYKNRYSKSEDSKVRYRVEFFPNSTLIDSMVCEKKKIKWSSFKDDSDYNKGVILEVKPLKLEQYSYDVTTESGHFEVSGVYSHNCRAFLSPWYERGGINPADENDKPIFVGRFNIGAVSLHLPMIFAKSRRENEDFYKVLDYYLEMIRKLHCRTYEYLGEMRASVNPIMFCEGGLYGGNLRHDQKIKESDVILPSATASFGITALNELQQLFNGKSLVEDGEFALEVMQYINKKIQEFKDEDGHLYAIYGTPAENLCGLQVEQFRKEFGIIEKVSDKAYVSNSFHCHVSEDISPIEKQDKEKRFWDLTNGGKIQYVRYPLGYNREAVKTLVLRAMKLGFYEGVNLALSYCDDCGYEQLEMDVCPKCGSKNLTKVDRMNGYLSYSRVKGDTRLNKAKMEEIKDRVSM